jgi:hypothetical protein
MSAPWNVIARSQGCFKNISVGWMASNPAQFNTRNTERISGSKKGTNIISASDILKNKNNRKM